MGKSETGMGATLRDVIRETTRQHLDAGYSVAGQCLSAVGFVANTVPDHPALTEFPMSDVAQSGFIVGVALMGKRPIYIVRYQGFQLLNSSFLLSYAAKSKAIWNRPCSMLVRSIAMEGAIGPVAGSSHHSLFTRMPGFKVVSPMTPHEWKQVYDDFMAGDDPVYVSEHRKSYDNDKELPDISITIPDVVLFPISITRFSAMEAARRLEEEGIFVAVHHVRQLHPFVLGAQAHDDLWRSRFGGIVLDDDFPGGVASSIAQQLHNQTGGSRVRVLALEERTAGFAERVDNLPPDAEKIVAVVKQVTKGWERRFV